MTKVILLLKQYWMVVIAGVVIGGFALSSISGDGPLGAADGKKQNSLNDLLREDQKKKKVAKPKRPSTPAPTREDLGLGDGSIEDLIAPIVVDEPLLEPANPEQCARNNTPEGTGNPKTKGVVRRVRYIDNTFFAFGEEYEFAVHCTISIYAKGCEDFATYTVFMSQDRTRKFGDIPRTMCEAAERAMHSKTPVSASGIITRVNSVTIKKLLYLEIG